MSITDIMNKYFKLNLDFFYFTANWMKSPQCNLSILALGQEYKCFLYQTRNKRKLLWLVYPSYRIAVAFCRLWQTCALVNYLIFTKNFLKTNLKYTANLPLPSAPRSLLKRHVVLAMWSLPNSDWLLYEQGLIMFLCSQQIWTL